MVLTIWFYIVTPTPIGPGESLILFGLTRIEILGNSDYLVAISR